MIEDTRWNPPETFWGGMLDGRNDTSQVFHSRKSAALYVAETHDALEAAK